MHQDPLLGARKKIAAFSLQKSYERIKKQKEMVNKYDESQLDSMYDSMVNQCIKNGFDNICTDYGDSSSVTCGKFTSNSKYFVTVGASGEGRVWNSENQQSQYFGKEVCQLKAVQKLCCVDIHPNIQKIPVFAPNILTGSAAGQIFVWTFDPQLKQQKSIKVKAHTDRINSIKFHQNCYTFLTGSYDMSWGLWDANRIKQLSNQKGHSRQIHSLSLHPDGSLVLTGDLAGDGMIWDLRTGKGIHQFTINNSIICSDFHPNGYQYAVAGKNNLINIFDLRRKKQIRTVPAHLKLISDLVYSKDGSLLFSASHDNTVKMWHGRNYSSVGSQLEHSAKVSSISFLDGKLGATMLDRKWCIWSRNKKKEHIKTAKHQN